MSGIITKGAAIARAWHWVLSHEGSFQRADDEGTEAHAFIKRSAELAAIAAVLVDVEPDARSVLERCWARFEHGDLLVRLANHAAIATVYVPFWRHGLRHEGLVRALIEGAVLATVAAGAVKGATNQSLL